MTKEQKEERRQLWKERVAAFKESGQSARAWCAANNLKEHQLKYWSDKYSVKEESVTQWVSVNVEKKPEIENENSVLTIKIHQVAIEVKPGFDPGLLRDVVKALNERC